MNFVKKTIFIFLVFFMNDIFCQNDWTLYPAKDSSTTKDSFTSINIPKDSNVVILDSSLLLDSGQNMKPINYIAENGHVIIKADYRLDSLNSYLSNKGTLNGFAVQLLVTQNTKKVRELRKIFTELFPEEYLFDEYIAPNIFLYAGKYFTMSDAVSLQKKLENSFDNTMVVRKKFPLKVIQKEE